MKNKIILNNITFEENKNIYVNKPLLFLEQCYKKPSYRKLRIFNDLIDFIRALKNIGYSINDYGIKSYNIFMFTFQIIIKDPVYNKELLLHITPSYNYYKELN